MFPPYRSGILRHPLF
ncbi:MAG: hypothetical protein GY847_19415 [Proteobacteria bacterium]|nr:hypothetical protein [Pseudomonadota bacterium]